MIRKTVRWTVTVLGCVAILGGAVAWYVWVNSDGFARDELQRRLSELAPACDLSIGKVRFDWDQALTVRDFAMGSKQAGIPPALTVPEGIIEIDRERLINDHVVDVRLIRLKQPQLDLVRRADGTWAINDLMPFQLNDIPLPEWRIEDGTLRFILEQIDGEPVVLALREANLRLIPSEDRKLLVKGLGDVSDAGQMQVTGEIDLEKGIWSLTGTVNGLSTSGDIAGFAMQSSAGIRDRMASLDRTLRDAKAEMLADHRHDVSPNAVPVRTVSRTGEVDVSVISGQQRVQANGTAPSLGTADQESAPDLASLGVEAIVDVIFNVGRADPELPVAFGVDLQFKDGQISNSLLPFPLRHLRGRIKCNNHQLELTGIRADSGKATLKLDGEFQIGEGSPYGWLAVDLSDLVVTDDYDEHVPKGVAKLIEIIRPSGRFDLKGAFDRDRDGTWTAREFGLVAKGAAVLPQPFPYPIRDIVGSVRQTQPGVFKADMTGTAGNRPVRLTAHVSNPGPDAEVDVRIHADRVRLDDTLLAAVNPEVRETLQRIGLQGLAESLDVAIFRNKGTRERFEWSFDAQVAEGVIEYEDFSYRLTKGTGDVSYSSQQDTLALRNIVAHHGQGIVAGSGTFRETPELLENGTSPVGGLPPGLDLQIQVKQIALDSDLRAALPFALQKTWDEFQPKGVADAEARVVWIPGHQPDIELTKVNLVQGGLFAKKFPYGLQDVEATAKYVPSRLTFQNGRARTTPAKLTIHEFVGWHAGGVRVASPNTLFQLLDSGDWELRLPELVIEDLEFGSDFRRAMPGAVNKTLESLNPQGRFQVEGRLDLRGSTVAGSPTTAGWNLTATTRNSATFNPGVEFSDVIGHVRIDGSHADDKTIVKGFINFEQGDVFGQRLEKIRGPFAFENGRVTFGNARAIQMVDDTTIPGDQRIVATYLGGILTLDAEIELDAVPRYGARVTLSGGSLEQYARSQPGQQLRNLAGVLNGYVNVKGSGMTSSSITGQGSLDISPAALYELPVIMQILTSLSSPDNTMFRKATSDFTIHDGAFHFNQSEGGAIVLAGDAVWLIGQGRVTFDRRLELELFNIPPQTPVRRVPLLGPLVGGVLNVATGGWVSFVVRGTADDPIVRQRLLPNLDDGLRRMFESFGPQPPPPKAAARPATIR